VLQNAVVQDLVPAQSVHRVIDTGNNMKHSSRQSRSEEKRVFLMVCIAALYWCPNFNNRVLPKSDGIIA